MHSKKDTFVVEVMDYQHLTKDRSLGVTDLSVADLVAEGPDKRTKPWIGTGKKARKDSLKIDGKRTVKGQIDYEVEFCEFRTLLLGLARELTFALAVPCAHLKNVSFNEPETDAIKEEDSVSTGSQTTATTADGVVENGDKEGSTKTEDDDEGIVIPREELIKTRACLLFSAEHH